VSRKRGIGRGPGILQVLSTAPEKPWPQGVVHHGARLAVLAFLAVHITFLFPGEGRQSFAPYEAGMVAEEDLLAEIPFLLPKTAEELDRDRATAAAVIPPTFLNRPEARDSMAARLDRFFDEVEGASEVGGVLAVDRVLTEEGISVLGGQSELLLRLEDLNVLRGAAETVSRELIPLVLDINDAQAISAQRIVVRYQNGEERSLATDSLLWGQNFLNQAFEALDPARPELESLFRLIIIRFFEPSFVLDPVATAQAQSQARETVPLTKGNIIQGESLLRVGQPIREFEVELLDAYEEALSAQGLGEDLGQDWGVVLGAGLLNLILLAIYGFLLFFFRAEVYLNFRWILLQGILILIYAVAGWGIAKQGFPSELLPIAFVALPVAVLWDGRMALVLALLLGVISGVQPPFNEFPILLVTLVGGATAALSARAVRRRSQTWIFIALITLGYSLAIVSQGLSREMEPAAILVAILWAAGNATASAILAMGFMPVFEWFTGITTDQTLLEWADPNRPLLKRLSMEAGGTYAHTINVANLAEAASTAIGANGLLTRVGIYYHDVGKMIKPHFFVENQPGGRNPHDKLKPHTSAAIVREHVVEGERMAREAGVPSVVADFIPEHHGTQLIGFFYEKAKEESEDEPNPEEFRYPGPRPRSRETAIAMLADSVESATRALQEPSKERVTELVKTIVEGKIRDGQLAESPLTLQEIDIIQGQFVKVVEGMFHHRLDYPATKHLTEVPSEEEPVPESTVDEASSEAEASDGSANGELPLGASEDPS
jgi:putative nucleotidyltransferase with HDIG domain